MTQEWRRIVDRRWIWTARFTYLVGLSILGFVIIPRGQLALEAFISWQSLRTQHERQVEMLAQGESLNEEYTALSSQLESLSSGSSGRRDSTYFLAVLQSKAEAAGVNLREVRPTAIDTLEAARATSISLQMDGQFHGVGTFVSLLENDRVPFHAMTLSVRSTDDDAVFLSADLQVKAYTILPTEEIR